MTPQEQVKMLREAVQSALTGIDDRYRGSSTHASVPVGSIDSLREALAATAPPPAYREWGERDIIHGDPVQKGGARTVLTLMRDATQREREACLAALLALAEKENAR